MSVPRIEYTDITKHLITGNGAALAGTLVAYLNIFSNSDTYVSVAPSLAFFFGLVAAYLGQFCFIVVNAHHQQIRDLRLGAQDQENLLFSQINDPVLEGIVDVDAEQMKKRIIIHRRDSSALIKETTEGFSYKGWSNSGFAISALSGTLFIIGFITLFYSLPAKA
ncbi:MAG: hypothetical protein AAGE61_04870 [Pseudomonadota bacterium]